MYRVHIGHTVSEGMVHALNNEELKTLKLVELLKPYDPKKDKAAPAKDAAQKGAGKKGRGSAITAFKPAVVPVFNRQLPMPLENRHHKQDDSEK